MSQKDSRSDKFLIIVIRFSLIIAFLLLWELLPMYGIIDEFFTSKPSKVFLALIDIGTTGRFFDQLAVSIQTYLMGLFFGSLLGLFLALLFYSLKNLKHLITPYVIVVAMIPKIILFPVFVKLFLEEVLIKVAFIGLMYSFVFIYLGVMAALNTFDKKLLLMGKTLTKNSLKLFYKFLFPYATYAFLGSLRLASIYSLVGTLFADMMLPPGIGYVILTLGHSFDPDNLLALTLLISLIAIGINRLMELLEDHASSRLRSNRANVRVIF